jgi:hypothetical protein
VEVESTDDADESVRQSASSFVELGRVLSLLVLKLLFLLKIEEFFLPWFGRIVSSDVLSKRSN